MQKRLVSSFFALRLLPALTVFCVVIAHYIVFVVAPDEQVMGPVQKIFYFHVGAALASYLCLGLLLFGSALYLIHRERIWDTLAESAASVAFMLCSIVLASGMIWGHSAWNTWWRWEPRLVSFLVLWLMLLSYVLLRRMASGHSRERMFAAVLGILCAVNVPIVVFSIQLLSQTEQLHPQVIERQGLQNVWFIVGMMMGVISMTLLSLWFVLVRCRQGLLSERIEILEEQ